MKIKTALYLLITFTLAACVSNTEVISTITPIFAATKELSATLEPIGTPTPEATPVSTKLEILNTIPAEMEEFYKLGLDTQELNGESMKVVLLESSTKYGEIKWKGKIINAWTEVLFTLNGKPVKGIIVHQWYDIDDKYRYKLETSGITIAPSPPNPNGVRVGTEALYADTPSDNPIVTLQFGPTGNEITDSVFEGAFPLSPFTGEDDELVFIPGVGWVIPTTHIDIREALVVPTPEE